MTIEHYGRWIVEGEVFEFTTPITLGLDNDVRTVDLRNFMTTDPDLRAEHIIEAMASGILVQAAEPSQEAMTPVRCPDCGRRGWIPTGVLQEVPLEQPDAADPVLPLRCPACRDKARN